MDARSLQVAIRNSKYKVINSTILDTNALRSVPIRIAKPIMPHMESRHLSAMEGAAYVFSQAPAPSITEIQMGHEVLDRPWMVINDGKRLYFVQERLRDYERWGLAMDENVYSFEQVNFVEINTGRPDPDIVKRVHKELIFFWAMVECLLLSPDDQLISRIGPGHEFQGGRRMVIPPATQVIIPDDARYLSGAANRAKSNAEEIARMGHAFARTTLRSEDGKSMSGYEAECHSCGRREAIPANGHSGSLPQTVIHKKFRQMGWDIRRRSTCPQCLNPIKQAEEIIVPKTVEAAPVQPIAIEPPRQMSPAERRNIFRAIDGEWDEKKGRYIGAASDQHIADTLKVPRAWVQEVREENFGKSQRNEDLDKVLGEAKNLRAEAARHAATALDLATKFEQLDVKYQELIRRLEAVE